MQVSLESRSDLETALFLSFLPYRISFYRRGGWRNLPSPDAGIKRFHSLLSCWFPAEEIQRARFLAASELRNQEADCFKRKEHCGWLTFWDSGFPRLLTHIFDPPPVLFWKGDPPEVFLKNNQGIPFTAVVGTRKPAPVAVYACDLLLDLLSGHTIVSGLALGIDRAAHLAAVRRKNPGIAVLAGGTEKAGPVSNLDIPERARTETAPFTLISEFPPSTEAKSYHFPRRNRIIAGLCEITYVMQAPVRSGALITARFALDNGRDVAAFDHPSLGRGVNEGCRNLLYDGAYPVSLAELDRRIISPQGQLEFWERKSQGRLRSLGDGTYYMEEKPEKKI